MVISFKELPGLRAQYQGKTIVLCTGTFDLTHAGHVLFFEDCKRLGDILMVMVGNDAAIKKSRGESRPILNQHIRLKLVDSLKPVDYSFFDFLIDGDNYYFACLDLALKTLRPDIYAVNDDAKDMRAREEMCRCYDVKLVVLPRICPPELEAISTTKIIEKIRNMKVNDAAGN